MKLNITKFLLFISISFFLASIAHASTDRDTSIQNALTCVDNHLHQGSTINWNDICDVPEPSEQQRLVAINQQLDQEEFSDSQNTPPQETSQDGNSRISTHHTILDYLKPSEPAIHPTKRKINYEIAYQNESYNYKTGNQWPYVYSQYFSESNLVKKSGTLNGVYLSSTWRGPLHTWSDFWGKDEIPNFAKIEFDVTDGSSTYNSYFTGQLKGINAWKMDGRLLLGFDHVWNETTDFTPYTGIGFRRSSDKAGGWEDFLVLDYRKYTAITNVYYLPVGLETHTNLNNQWEMDFKLEGDFVLFGKTSFSLNDIPGPLDAVDGSGQPIKVFLKETDSTLKGGFGVRTSFKLIRKYKLCSLFIEPYFEYLYLNESNKAQEKALGTNGINYVSVYPNLSPYYPVYLPKNSTFEVGTRMGVQF